MLYHIDLQLPVEFRVEHIQPIDTFKETCLSPTIINREFHQWLDTLELYVYDVRYFNSTPNQRYRMHVDDSRKICEIPKINIMYDSYGTVMNWYELKPGRTGTVKKNGLGDDLLIFSEQDVILAHTARVDTPCLINGGGVHDLTNTDNRGVPRRCYSLFLGDTNTKKTSTWIHAASMLGDHLL